MLILFLIQLLFLRSIIADNYTNELGPGYGEDWIIFTDDDGETHYIELNNTVPEPNRGYIFGDIYYFLFSRNNENNPEEIIVNKNPLSISSSYFDPNKTTKIITHGWRNNSTSNSVMNIANAYMENTDYNILAVDWGEIATNPIYPYTAASTRWVGKSVATLLEALNNSYNVSADKVHLIGHSLGAQVMGFAGSFSKQNVYRITGLDPARPLFEFPYYDKSYALDSDDADFVDIIHTCAGIYGYEYEHGDADFYPNGGHPSQPGCEGIQPMLEACSHGRAYKFFAESIYNKEPKFVSYGADSWRAFRDGNFSINTVLMGEYVKRTARGRYYLYTGAEPKFALSDCLSKCGDNCCENNET